MEFNQAGAGSLFEKSIFRPRNWEGNPAIPITIERMVARMDQELLNVLLFIRKKERETKIPKEQQRVVRVNNGMGGGLYRIDGAGRSFLINKMSEVENLMTEQEKGEYAQGFLQAAMMRRSQSLEEEVKGERRGREEGDEVGPAAEQEVQLWRCERM